MAEDGHASESPLALIQACASGKLAEVRRLLAAGHDPAARFALPGQDRPTETVSPMTAAISFAQTVDTTPRVAGAQALRILRALIEAGAPVVPAQRELLVAAVRAGHMESIDLVLERGAQMTPYAMLLTREAIAAARPAVLEHLARHGVALDERTAGGSTAFLDVCAGLPPMTLRSTTGRSGQTIERFIGALRGLGIDIGARDKLGANALMRASASGQAILAHALIEAGVSLTDSLPNGVNSIALIIARGDAELARFVLGLNLPRRELARLKLERLQPDVRTRLAERTASVN